MTRDQIICEALGLCWHNFDNDSGSTNFTLCRKCGKWKSELSSERQYNPDFSTPEGFFLIMDEGPKQEWWYKFVYWMQEQDSEFLSCILPVYRCELIPKKFINSVVISNALDQFLKERSKE